MSPIRTLPTLDRPLPEAGPAPLDTEAGVPALGEWLAAGDVAVLSGAGMSTESGIPDYRGSTGRLRRHTPMTYQAFIGDPAARHRYWARGYLGWRQLATARPNDGHRAVAALGTGRLLAGIVTQNVDGLHQAAGSTGVIELHGGLDRVFCHGCRRLLARAELDRILTEANRDFDADVLRIHPDGDAELPDEALDGFVMVDCPGCGGGPLKPDVVFFGEPVPRNRVARCMQLVEAARALLVLGSSLTVMSGYRFVLRARALGRPVLIVNQGPTRGDAHAEVRVDAPLGVFMPALAEHLLAS